MIIIGERINTTVKKVRNAVINRDEEFLKEMALSQVKYGADYLDCMVGGIDNAYEHMLWLVEFLQKTVDCPLCLDSDDINLLKSMMKKVDSKHIGIINSVSGMSGKCETLFPVVAGTSWKVVALTCNDTGIPESTDEKIEIVKSILKKADQIGVKREQLIFDPCIMALIAKPNMMMDFIKDTQAIKKLVPECSVMGAVSNISYEMPARSVINSTCLIMAAQAGADVLMVNPCNQDIINARYAVNVLMNQDQRGIAYNRAWRNGQVEGRKEIKHTEGDLND